MAMHQQSACRGGSALSAYDLVVGLLLRLEGVGVVRTEVA
jgi:hypothetical protein